jgi:hypothetical protein
MRSSLVLIVAASYIALAAAIVRAEQGDAIKLEAGVAQLFIDDYLIESQSNLKRTLHQPRKDNGGNVPVLAIENEFDGRPATLQSNGSIVYDKKLGKWVMFAIGCSLSQKTPDRVRLYRFTSPDAMNWTKGDDGTPQYIKFDLSDPATGQVAVSHDLFSCYYDEHDAARAYKGWLYIWGQQTIKNTFSGLYYVSSADGLTWDRGPQLCSANTRQIEQDGRGLVGVGDVTVFAPDPVSGRFLGLLRFLGTSPPEVVKQNSLRSRAYLFVDRLDAPLDLERVERVDLVPPATNAGGDMPHDQYYGSTAWRYGSMWLGGLRVWHGGGDYPYSAAGSAFLKFLSSRDGLHWKKVPFDNDAGVPEVFIPNGPEGGNDGKNDGGYMTEFSTPPIRVGDELIYYYGCSSWGKNHPDNIRISGGGVFRARLRPDGFVSVNSGTLTTKPLAFAGSNLLVNGVGPINVAILSAEGQVLGKADISGDSLAHEVNFDATRGGSVRLRFSVQPGGKLYAFSTR